VRSTEGAVAEPVPCVGGAPDREPVIGIRLQPDPHLSPARDAVSVTLVDELPHRRACGDVKGGWIGEPFAHEAASELHLRWRDGQLQVADLGPFHEPSGEHGPAGSIRLRPGREEEHSGGDADLERVVAVLRIRELDLAGRAQLPPDDVPVDGGPEGQRNRSVVRAALGKPYPSGEDGVAGCLGLEVDRGGGGDLAPRPVAGHVGAQIGEAESTFRPCRTKRLTRRLLVEG
jgi:hypothetical protein